MAARTRPQALAFPWARTYDADQLDAFIEGLWAAASGDNDLATLDAIEEAIATHRPPAVPCPLTPREIEILTEIASGESYESAARNLGLSLDTVRSRCVIIYGRLGTRRGAQATAIAVHHGWLPGLRVTAAAPDLSRLAPNAWKAIYRERAAEMRKHPGKVVEIGPYGSRNGAYKSAARINKGQLDVFQAAGSFEAEVVPVQPSRWIVRARYVGTPVDASQEDA